MTNLTGRIAWVDLRNPELFEGQILCNETNRKYYFNYSVARNLKLVHRDMPVTFTVDKYNLILEVL